MSWYLAPALRTFRSQCDSSFPNRDKSQDGTIGDEAHSSRSSDHNPDGDRSVNAVDITHDPRGGIDCNVLAKELVALMEKEGSGSRGSYVIWNRRIWSQQRRYWRAYTGPNGHTKHLHFSITHGSGERDPSLWPLPIFGGVVSGRPGVKYDQPKGSPTLRVGSTGEAVKFWQKIVGVKDDGEFGPNTQRATKAWQSANGLTADGVVGPATWGIASQKLMAFISASKAATVDSKQYPNLKVGSKGDKVELWQSMVGVKADGDFGKATERATKAWQKNNDIPVTGSVDALSWAVGLELFARFINAVKKVEASWDARAKKAGYTTTKYPNLKRGAQGDKVRLWQQLVQAPVTGKFDQKTVDHTMWFKAGNGLSEAPGEADKKAWVTALELLKKLLSKG